MPIQRNVPLSSTMPTLTLTTGATGNYTIQFPATNGTAGQALANNGSGTLTFQTLSAAAPVGFTSSANGELTASGGSTNQSFAIIARGTGSILSNIPTGNTTGGYPPTSNGFRTYSTASVLAPFDGQSNIALCGQGDHAFNSTSYATNINSISTYLNSSNYATLVTEQKSAIALYAPDAFCGPRAANVTSNETRYFTFAGPSAVSGLSSTTSSYNSGIGPHISLGGYSQVNNAAGYDCIMAGANSSTFVQRYAAFGCVTTNSTSQYMTPDGSVQTATPNIAWGSIPRTLTSATTAKNWFAWGTVLAMKSGGTDYRVWRFYMFVDSAGTIASFTSVVNSAGAAGWAVNGSTSGANLSGFNIQVTGGLLDTIRWFGGAWVIETN